MVPNLVLHLLASIDNARVIQVNCYKVYQARLSGGLIYFDLLFSLLVESDVTLRCLQFILEVKLFDLSAYLRMLHFQAHFIKNEIVLDALHVHRILW